MMLAAVSPSPSDWLLLVAMLVLLAIAAVLSLAETALTRISRVKAAAMVDEGRKRAGDLQHLVEHPEQWLNTILLSVLVCQLAQATLAGVVAGRLLGAWGVLVSAVFNIAVVFVVAEAAPKTWALLHPERAALAAAKPVRLLAALPPLRLAARGLIGITNVILPGKGIKGGPYVTEEEILALAEAAAKEDVIERGELEMIESIIEFGDTVVREVMVPRPDMVTIDLDFRVKDAMEVSLLNGYSRIPVCGEGIDDVVGIVIAKDLMRAERDGQLEAPVAGIMRPPLFVPETKRVAELLPQMQSEQVHLAIVVDEYGGTAGVVSLEDLIEELVGEIVDEFDREESMIEPLPGGVVRVSGRMPVDELNELLRTTLPEGDWDTVGGLMFHLLGHVPVEGEVVEAERHQLRAERVKGRRIGRVRITPMAIDEGAAVDGAMDGEQEVPAGPASEIPERG